jgi:hypothetical protein
LACVVPSDSIAASFKNVSTERRKDIRFRPAAQIVVLCLDTEVETSLYDLGSGGFSIRSVKDLALGTVQRFKFSTPDGVWSTILTAQAVHSRADPDATAAAFILGFKFLNSDSTRVAASINALIDRATSVISFS